MRSKGIFHHHHRREGCGDKHGVFGRGRGMRGGPGRGLDRGEGMGRGHGRRGGGRLFDHGSLRWLLLSLIAEKPDHEPSHGYELIKAVETRLGGAYSPSPGVIYPTLTLLEEMGALEASAQGGKKLYAITETGRALLAENAEAVAAVQARMDKFAAHVRRPEAIQDAIGRLRATVHARLTGETALTEAQVKAVADILNAAADGVEKA
ncbi:MAG: PadR family transcriptional regulator [Brevundimonas sp.]|uniref:PadR family transcriptional regulator n=1 Tax=Brevundimonas albigilva TaxID=1312364 RepID=A0ABY4SM81_9CAUL|nr:MULTISPECIES: PadR family transcriptional regulator [Brevundimonas]PZU57275.1 MAG: PadR family transcriptional regulator [Brevundimonas sp.]UQV17355.1 PadR family transcriptional regulator [Brevundimonas albigilva]URI14791.1 PadR family transcriptional regulator [Brevundimonas albigilva]